MHCHKLEHEDQGMMTSFHVLGVSRTLCCIDRRTPCDRSLSVERLASKLPYRFAQGLSLNLGLKAFIKASR
jgi:hypothetical protein